ncbi:hypothetical protein BDV96DRAFT_151580 [Lophiotrema nucula]|uniref:Uncharacterized protein n=1 Tax=Lophiotrema nucula TaxID=690887 RepID=A0A6A5Z120_9PLEO|nr:hypothetical protein BDV96DRAFT_151580 [Lophiotrema nucula]
MASFNSSKPHAQPPGNLIWREETYNSFSDDNDDDDSAAGGVAIEEANQWAAGVDVDQMKTQALTREQRKQPKQLEAALPTALRDRLAQTIRRSVTAACPDSERDPLAQRTITGQNAKAFDTITDLLDGFNFADPTTLVKGEPVLTSDTEARTLSKLFSGSNFIDPSSQMNRDPILISEREAQISSLAARNQIKKGFAKVTGQNESEEQHINIQARFKALYMVQQRYARKLGVSLRQYQKTEHPEDGETLEQLVDRVVEFENQKTIELAMAPRLNTEEVEARQARKMLKHVQEMVAYVLDVPVQHYRLNGPHPEDKETREELCARLERMRRWKGEFKKKHKARIREMLAVERGGPELLPKPQVKNHPKLNTDDKKARKKAKQMLRTHQEASRLDTIKKEDNDMDVIMEDAILGMGYGYGFELPPKPPKVDLEENMNPRARHLIGHMKF